jgi:hypothetical protein
MAITRFPGHREGLGSSASPSARVLETATCGQPVTFSPPLLTCCISMPGSRLLGTSKLGFSLPNLHERTHCQNMHQHIVNMASF